MAGKRPVRREVAGIRRGGTPPAKKDVSVKTIVISSISGIVGTLLTAGGVIGAAQVTNSKPPAESTCSSVFQEYDKMIQSNPMWVEVLTTPGGDGRVPILVDVNAKRCGLGIDAIRKLKKSK